MLRSELFLVIARLSNDAEVLTATMIRFVDEPRLDMDLSDVGGEMVRLLYHHSVKWSHNTTIGEESSCAGKADKIAEVRPSSS